MSQTPRTALLLALLSALAPASASAAVGFKSSDGWEVSFDGFVNAFGVNGMGSRAPDAAVATPDPLMSNADRNSFRIRTGLLPGLFGINVSAPETDGIAVKGRIGLYPQVNNSNTRNAFGSQIDLREVFFTADGKFGQVLVGRALNLFQGKNILTDMSLFGVGVQGAVSSGGTTLGRIGYGYLYSQFGAQFRYTTPAAGGVKLAVAVVDPSQICGAGACAADTKAPGVESELSYAGTVAGASVQGWVSGLYQTASTAAGDRKVAAGAAAGVGVHAAGFDVLVSGFAGDGLGSFLLLDTDSLDADGEERRTLGGLAQVAYTLGRTKIGASYGRNALDETARELADRRAALPSALSSRESFTGGVYHDVSKHLKVVAEYTHASARWHGGQRQSDDVMAVGGFFLW